MKRLLTVLLFALFIFNSYPIIPPKKGVTPPADFTALKKNIEKDYRHGFYAQRMETRKALREKIGSGALQKSALKTDTVFALTLLGRYSDSYSTYEAASFQQQLFDGPNPNGTLKDFYNEISYGQMYMSGAALGWYNLPGSKASYVGSDNGLSPSEGPKFVYDLVVESDKTLNFANYIQYYDASNNPHIGFVAAIHTGGDGAAGANNIWSHRWSFSYFYGSYTTNDIDPKTGKKVIIDGDYAVEPEMNGGGNTGGSIVEIGVFAHEFGHIFGLPDLYDTDYSSEGLGNWCLMAGGSYGGNGNAEYCPSHMSAWCKKELGWVTPVDITTYQQALNVPNVEENPVIYRMWKQNQSGGTEYFLVENRQLIGFDRLNLNKGFLIYHVDENQYGNSNESDYLVDLEQADGLRQLNHAGNRGDAGDPFPGSTNNTRFDIRSTPNSSSYFNGDTYVSVRNIHLNGTDAIGDFDIGTQPFLQVQNVNIEETNNQNGRVEPGEFGSITLDLSNIGSVPSTPSGIDFSLNDPSIQLLKTHFDFSSGYTGTSSLKIDSVFKLNQDFNPKMIYLKYHFVSDNNSYKDSSKFVLGIPKIAVVSKAENKSFINYYVTSLQQAGHESEELYNEIPAFASDRNVIIYFTGQTKDSLFTSTEIDTLTKFVENGGNLLFSGQNIAEYLNLNFPSFLHNVIGINFIKSGSPFYKNIYGKKGDLLGDNVPYLLLLGTEGARNERSPDVISSNGSFNMSLSYKQDQSEGAGGWIQTSNGGKIIFLGFGFESISNNESAVSRTDVMRSLLSRFDINVDVNDQISVPSEYTLSQNYPNPFNPSTRIKYALPKSSFIRLELYDITGRRIAVLINKEQQQGTYDFDINMTELNLSSGVYFYRMTAGDFNTVKKMMFLK